MTPDPTLMAPPGGGGLRFGGVVRPKVGGYVSEAFYKGNRFVKQLAVRFGGSAEGGGYT